MYDELGRGTDGSSISHSKGEFCFAQTISVSQTFNLTFMSWHKFQMKRHVHRTRSVVCRSFKIFTCYTSYVTRGEWLEADGKLTRLSYFSTILIGTSAFPIPFYFFQGARKYRPAKYLARVSRASL